MGFIKLEKNNDNIDSAEQSKSFSDSVYINSSLNNLNNVGNDVYVFEPKDEKKVSSNLVNAGMNGSKLQHEGSLIGMCLTTFVCSFFVISLIIGLSYLALSLTNGAIEIFPYRSNYTAEEFNDCLKRSFIILFCIVSVLSIISMIVINNTVKSCFKDQYLSKIKIFLYDAFVVVQNVLLYICEMWIMFQIVNNIHKDLIIMQTNGTIIGNVNIETIEIFKYVIVIIMTIFIVLNSFSSIDIIHQKNKFVLEDQI